MAEHVCSHSSNAGFGLVFTPFMLTYPKKRDFGNGFIWFLITFHNGWAMYWLYSKDRLVSIIYVPYVYSPGKVRLGYLQLILTLYQVYWTNVNAHFWSKIGREIQWEKPRFDILSNNGTGSIIISVFLIPPKIIQIMGSKLMSA